MNFEQLCFEYYYEMVMNYVTDKAAELFVEHYYKAVAFARQTGKRLPGSNKTKRLRKKQLNLIMDRYLITLKPCSGYSGEDRQRYVSH